MSCFDTAFPRFRLDWRGVGLMVLLALCSFTNPAVGAGKRNTSVAQQTNNFASGTEQRIALVIGNAAYKSSPLANPVNDARAVAAKLKAFGFEVIERENLQQKQLGSVMREFRARLRPGAVALFFYAGHGVQVKGVNYLPVTDADITTEEDVRHQSLDVNEVLALLEEAKSALNLVFLDACRNNPYSRSFRSAADGLAKVNVAASGTLISFATRPGSVAADGTGKNGLYTEQLLKVMELEDEPIELALKRVGSAVKQASQGSQEPWSEGHIDGYFYFRRSGKATPVAPVNAEVTSAASGPRNNNAEAVELAFWESIKNSDKKADFEAYLDKYPDGQFAAVARNRAGSWISDANGCRVAYRNPEPNQSITWSGPCIKGKAHGRGIMESFVNGQKRATLEGELREGEPFGVVVVTYVSGGRYEGTILNGKRAGKGMLKYADGTQIEANFVEGRAEGKAVITFPNGNRYEGDVKNDKPNGKGTLTKPNGERYVGDVVDGKAHGRGVVTTVEGIRYEGDFKGGTKEGHGSVTWPNGNRYEGDVRNNKLEGRGIYTWKNGNRYVGDFMDGKPHGRGVIANTSGQRREGNFINGEFVR